MQTANTIPQGTIIEAHQHLVIIFASQFIDNSDESLVLFDSSGKEIDNPPALSDTTNNRNTWQRENDDDERWASKPETKGNLNN